MDNPWRHIAQVSSSFVLDEDNERIQAFNHKADSDHKIHLELLPEPYIGKPNAEIVLLGLNPGYSEKDWGFHRKRRFRQAWHDNLLHLEQPYPFYLIDPRNQASPGGIWWRKSLLALWDYGTVILANHIACIEYFPYHSKRYRSLGNPPLMSQEYSFHLVRQAIERGALIIIMRHRTSWLKCVSELGDYERCFSSRNPRLIILSEGNLPDGFTEIRSTLRRFLPYITALSKSVS